MEDLPNDWNAPIWKDARKVHEWKNYISEEMRALWGTFTDAQKQAIAQNAKRIASQEHWD
jgi:hypothetical protein